MSKLTVTQIRKESEKTRATFKGRRGDDHAKNVTVRGIRNYCDRVDFLCRTVAKLEKKCRG